MWHILQFSQPKQPVVASSLGTPCSAQHADGKSLEHAHWEGRTVTAVLHNRTTAALPSALNSLKCFTSALLLLRSRVTHVLTAGSASLQLALPNIRPPLNPLKLKRLLPLPPPRPPSNLLRVKRLLPLPPPRPPSNLLRVKRLLPLPQQRPPSNPVKVKCLLLLPQLMTGMIKPLQTSSSAMTFKLQLQQSVSSPSQSRAALKNAVGTTSLLQSSRHRLHHHQGLSRRGLIAFHHQGLLHCRSLHCFPLTRPPLQRPPLPSTNKASTAEASIAFLSPR